MTMIVRACCGSLAATEAVASRSALASSAGRSGDGMDMAMGPVDEGWSGHLRSCESDPDMSLACRTQ